MSDRRQTILMALFDCVAEMQRAGTLRPIAEDYQQLLTAAEPSDPGDTTAGPRFAAALIQLAANALVRLTDLQDTGLGDVLHTAGGYPFVASHVDQPPPGRRWFRCRHCKVLHLGAALNLQTATEERDACLAHEKECPAPERKAAELHAASWFLAAPEQAADVRLALQCVGCYQEEWNDREWTPGRQADTDLADPAATEGQAAADHEAERYRMGEHFS